MELKDRNWREFYIKDIFIFENKNKIQMPTGAYIHKNNLIKGKTPRITVTSQNNGIDGYYDSKDKNYRIYRNFISVSFLGTIFYHKYCASLDMKVHCLQLINRDLNPFLSKFLISEIKKSIELSSYGNQLSSSDLPNKKIMLPINNIGKPDYVFMEAYVKSEEEFKRQKYIAYAKKKLSKIKYKEISPLEKTTWNEFRLLELFNYKRGNQNNMNALPVGKHLLISAKNINNGLKGFYNSNNDKKSVYEGKCITLNNDGDGGVGLAYYQHYEFLLDSHVYALYSKTALSKYAKLFISLCLSKQRVCFSHGRSISISRLSKIKLMLPINNEGNPDYACMEQYTKNIEYKKITKYLKFHCNRFIS